jgi:SET family sugar efflux transporter-like MFS transporter
LAIYNTGGFVASLLVPAYADRARDYVRPMLACGVLTLALAGVLAATTSLQVAVTGLVLLGGPAGVGSSLLFAHLKHTGAAPGDVVRTRALVSVAWVAGPPLAAALFATVAGVGLTLFQQIIPRPGVAAGLYANTRRLGAIAAGPLIGLGSATRLGYGGVFAASAVITVAALGGLRLASTERRDVVHR